MPGVRARLRHAQHPGGRVRRRSAACSGASARCRSRSAWSSPRSRSSSRSPATSSACSSCMPVAIIAWFVFIRPTHRARYREAIADLPRWDLRADGRSSRGGRLVQAERRALVVAAELEAAEAGDRLRGLRRRPTSHVLDAAAELVARARAPRRCRRRAKNSVRRPRPGRRGGARRGSPAVSIVKPVARRAGRHRPAEQRRRRRRARARGPRRRSRRTRGRRSWAAHRRFGHATAARRLGRLEKRALVERDDARAAGSSARAWRRSASSPGRRRDACGRAGGGAAAWRSTQSSRPSKPTCAGSVGVVVDRRAAGSGRAGRRRPGAACASFDASRCV